MSDIDDIMNGIGGDAPSEKPAAEAPSEHPDLDAIMNGIDQPARPKTQRAPINFSSLPYAKKVSQIESGGNPDAQSATGTAGGLGQFTDDTWVDQLSRHRPDIARGKSRDQLLAMKSDPGLNEEMIDRLGDDNAAILQKNNVPVNDASKYGAHWFGAKDFQKIYSADPSTPIESILGDETAKNNGLSGKSAGDVKTLTANKMHMNYMPQDLGWGDTIEQAGENLLPSAGKVASGALRAAMHPVDTAMTMGHIAKGLYSKLDGLNGEPQDPQKKAEDEQLVDALGAMYKQDYGSIDGFKQKLANDPAGVLMDASTLLSGGLGAAKVAGTAVGKVGSTVGRIAPAAGEALTNVGDKLTGLGKGVFDSAGNVTPKVDAMIQKATDGAMSGKDLVDPEVRRAFAQTIQAKGLSEDTVKEGLMKAHGLETPTQVISGKGAPHEAKDKVRDAIEGNNDKLDAATTAAFPGPSPTDIGEALDQAHTQSYNNAGAMYDRIRTMPGSFGPTMPNISSLGSAIKNKLKASGIPASNLQTLTTTGHPQAAAALKMIGGNWGAGKTLMQGAGGVDAKEVLAMRKALNNFTSNAQGQDLKAMRDITDMFDNHVASQSALGLFRDASGQPVTGLGTAIKQANSAYKKHFDTFETRNGQNNSLVSAMQTLKKAQGRNGSQLAPSGDSAAYTAAQSGIARDLMHPQKGPGMYNQLTKALGGNTAPIDDFVKNSVMNGEKPTKNAGQLLNKSPVVTQAFAGSPQDLARAKHLQFARDLNNAKPTPSIGKSGLRNIMGGLARKGVFSLAGYETLGPAGLVVGPMAEAGYEHMRDSRIQSKAMRGAAKTPNLLGKATTIGRVGNYVNNADNVDRNIQRASGGKVDMESMVSRLMSAAKRMKKETDDSTKPLLNVPDEHIVKALDIAQEHI